ncbi:MAG: 16S rRNA (guanine527-N7)-methyltransferase [bacterium]|jgi:16S rRNA (guanine527-N7)-methyltransferase
MQKTIQLQKELQKEFENLDFSSQQISQIEQFLSLLEKWNKKINLTSIREPREIFGKHILDSLIPFHIQVQELQGKVLDLGSGAGLPSIILSIMNPDLEIFSIDKVSKKIMFQDMVKSQLRLKNFNPMHTRLEDIENHPNFHMQIDCMVSRAFEKIDGTLNRAKQFLKPEGSALLWKGQNWESEFTPSENDLQVKQKWRYDFPEYNLGGNLLLFQREN